MLTVTDPNKQVLPLDCQHTKIENPAALEHHRHDSWVACGIWIVTHGMPDRGSLAAIHAAKQSKSSDNNPSGF